jgi:hypothetical protein
MTLETLFKNPVFQRSVYLVALLIWSAALYNEVLDCFSCSSSSGIPYGILYWVPAVVMLLQLVFNTRLLWWATVLSSFTVSVYLLLDNYFFMVDTSSKVEFTPMDMLISEIILLLILSTANLVLLVIRPECSYQPADSRTIGPV